MDNAISIFIQSGRIKTRRVYQHGEIRHVKIRQYLRVLITRTPIQVTVNSTLHYESSKNS